MRRLAWIPALGLAVFAAWMGSLSTAPFGIPLHHPRDWFAHAAEFAALGLALEVAVRSTWRGTPVYRRHLWLALGLSLFGAADEWHQHLVPGRAADTVDWLADTLGACLGLALSCLPLLWKRWLETLSWVRGRAGRPDPSVPLIVVADPHWSEALTGLAEATADHPGADWLFLGDAFDVWVGVPGMETPLQEAFLAWVDARRAAGRWVGFWMGNREYFLDRHAGRFDLMGEGLGGGLPGEGLAFEHGDLINTADWRYRLWNLASRSGLMWAFARALPRATARRLAANLERSLRTTNRAYKLAFPREAFRAAAAEQPGVFITGHFHTFEVEGNGTALPWAHEGKFMIWRGGELKPLDASLHP